MAPDKMQGTAPLSRKQNLLVSTLGEGTLILILAAIAWITHWPFIFASLGPTAYEQVELPRSRSSRPYNIITGHLVALGSGFFMLWVLNAWDSPNILALGYVSWPRLWASAIAAALTAGLTQLLYASQPASLATSLLVTLGLMQTARDAIAIIIGVLILTAVGEPMRRLLAKHPPLAKNQPVVN
ncbi:MAG TPA: HPP family protein [Terriglobia bacterium]|nr:HPP family protein [Terriglobia bacterium]